MQQTLICCAFCDAPPGTETDEAHTYGQEKLVTYLVRVDCAIQVKPDPDERDHVACDGCGLVVDTPAALTQFRVEVGHLEGPLQLCARCSPGGLVTYWTWDVKERLVATPAE